MIKMGSKVKDQISGFTGCAQVLASPIVTKAGLEALWYDEQRIIVLKEGVATPKQSSATAGGPQRAPSGRH